MKRIVAALDSAFAASADDFYDSLYGGKDQPAPEQYTRASHWENFPTDSHIYDDIGVSGHYNVTPEEHQMLHDWRGPNGEQVEYEPEHPDGDNSDEAKYTVVHHLPDGSSKWHTIHPPSSYNSPDLYLGRSKWTHGYNWTNPSQDYGSGIIEANWHGEAPEYENNGDLKTILDRVHRLNGGEPLRTVYPPRRGLHDEG